jgi:hypothetical protein
VTALIAPSGRRPIRHKSSSNGVCARHAGATGTIGDPGSRNPCSWGCRTHPAAPGPKACWRRSASRFHFAGGLRAQAIRTRTALASHNPMAAANRDQASPVVEGCCRPCPGSGWPASPRPQGAKTSPPRPLGTRPVRQSTEWAGWVLGWRQASPHDGQKGSVLTMP